MPQKFKLETNQGIKFEPTHMPLYAAFWIVPAAVPAAVPAGSFQAGRPAVFQRRSGRALERRRNGAGTALERGPDSDWSRACALI